MSSSSKDHGFVDASPGEKVRAVLTDELLLRVTGSIVPPDPSLPPVTTNQQTGFLFSSFLSKPSQNGFESYFFN